MLVFFFLKLYLLGSVAFFILTVFFGRWLIDEGSRPIFERDELMNSDPSLAPPVEQRRIVAMPPVRSRSPAGKIP